MRPPNRFVPCLEVLEDRSLLSCSIKLGGSNVYVTGDNLANTVKISDNGLNNAGNIVVSCDGMTASFDRAISTVFFDTMGNPVDTKDVVTYNLLNHATTRSVSVKGLLGDGNDQFAATLGRVVNNVFVGDLLVNSNLTFDVNGGAGDDTLTVNASTNDIDLHSGAVLTMRLIGGGDNDGINTLYTGELDGTILMLLDGSEGVDDVRCAASLATGSSGRFGTPTNRAFVKGGTGVFNDTLRFIVKKQDASDIAQVSATADGGDGFDTLVRSEFVTHVNCESVSSS